MALHPHSLAHSSRRRGLLLHRGRAGDRRQSAPLPAIGDVGIPRDHSLSPTKQEASCSPGICLAACRDLTRGRYCTWTGPPAYSRTGRIAAVWSSLYPRGRGTLLIRERAALFTGRCLTLASVRRRIELEPRAPMSTGS